MINIMIVNQIHNKKYDNNNFIKPSRECILELAEFVLKRNIVQFNGNKYISSLGIGQGLDFGAQICDITMLLYDLLIADKKQRKLKVNNHDNYIFYNAIQSNNLRNHPFYTKNNRKKNKHGYNQSLLLKLLNKNKNNNSKHKLHNKNTYIMQSNINKYFKNKNLINNI
eukprot:315966_1